MLGSLADSEDVLQDAFLRWLGTDRGAVREPEAFLRRIVTRLCLDFLKSARNQRETYVGTWLPEPIVETDEEEVEDITLPLMLTLERLSPLERAAFLLHDVFGVNFDEIAETLGREPAACRQLASRARTQVRAARPRFQVPKEHGLEIAAAFFTASRGGDMQKLRSLLAADVAIYADGGGKRSAATNPIKGIEQVMRAHIGLARMFSKQPSSLLRYGFVNGLPGFVTREADGPQTTGLQIEDGKVVAIYVMRNPDKLQRVGRRGSLRSVDQVVSGPWGLWTRWSLDQGVSGPGGLLVRGSVPRGPATVRGLLESVDSGVSGCQGPAKVALGPFAEAP